MSAIVNVFLFFSKEVWEPPKNHFDIIMMKTTWRKNQDDFTVIRNALEPH